MLIKSGALLSFTMEDADGSKITITKSNFDNILIKKTFGVKVIVRASTFGISKLNCANFKAALKMDGNRLYVNLWPFTDNGKNNGGEKTPAKSDEFAETKSKVQDINDKMESKIDLFYELPDDHAAKFSFKEWTATGITIPVKYRFKNSRATITEDANGNKAQTSVSTETFSASANAVLFAGHSWGDTKFIHRKKIGNREISKKITLGAFIGFSALEIATSNSDRRLGNTNFDPDGTIGTFNYGVGMIGSYNKISMGVFAGIDNGVGDLAQSWIYNGNPWIGVGIGYELFKLL